MASEIFQKITCTLKVMYNLNVRHIESLMLNMVGSPAVYKRFFVKFIQEFIVVFGGRISYIRWKVFSISYFFQYYIMTLNRLLR